jgi:serine protease Do
MGIGFAIPINMARNVMEGLIKDGRVVRGWLGVAIQNLNEELATSFNHPSTDGALVGDVQPEGPSKGVLKEGDIIVSFDGQKIKNVNQLRNLVASAGPGKTVQLGVIREGRQIEVPLKLGELPSSQSGETPAKDEALDETSETLGMAVENLTADLARRLNSKRTVGVVITRVAPGSLAQSAGLQPKDIIVSVNGTAVTSVAEFRKLTTVESLAKGVRLVVESEGMNRFVILRVQ